MRKVSVQIRPRAPPRVAQQAEASRSRRGWLQVQVLPRGPTFAHRASARQAISGMPTGQANRASVLTSACLRASGASPRHSAIFSRRPQSQQRGFFWNEAVCRQPQLGSLCFLLFNFSARSSKRTVRLISGVALDECLDPERYRTRVPFRTPEREVDRAAQPFHH
jgi:hypothetical protein